MSSLPILETRPRTVAVTPVDDRTGEVATARRTGSRYFAWGVRASAVVAAVLLWQLLTANKVRCGLRFDTLPTVTEIVAALTKRIGTEQYWLDLGQSTIRILTGFGLAAVLGVITGIWLGRSPLFANIFGPLTELARPIPAIAIVPVAILLFPSDEAGIVFITFLAAYFPIMVSTRHAVRALPTLWEESVRTLGGSLGCAVAGGTARQPSRGLWRTVRRYRRCLDLRCLCRNDLGPAGSRVPHVAVVHGVGMPDVFVGIITIGVLGFVTSAAVELVGRRVTRWLPRAQEARS